MSTTQPIRDPEQVRALGNYFLKKGQLRNHLLVVLSVHTALRISDILRLTCDDVYDFKNNRVRESVSITEKKTGKTKTVKLNEKIITALKVYVNAHCAKPGRPLIASPRTAKAITRVQAYRIIRAAAETIELQTRVSCHSLRKTFGYLAWKNGIPVPIIMEIYNHSSYNVTKRYLGISQDDKNEVYEKLAEIA